MVGNESDSWLVWLGVCLVVLFCLLIVREVSQLG